VNDAGEGRPTFIADRVGPFLRRFGELRRCRHKLSRDRVGGIGPIDQFRYVLGHGNSKLGGNKSDLLKSLTLDEASGNEFVSAEGHAPFRQ
jgi:hypothetical protein